MSKPSVKLTFKVTGDLIDLCLQYSREVEHGLVYLIEELVGRDVDTIESRSCEEEGLVEYVAYFYFDTTNEALMFKLKHGGVNTDDLLY